MSAACAFLQDGALSYAEAVLLVGNDKSQPREAHRCTYQGVSADNYVALSVCQRLSHASLLALAHRADQKLHFDAKGREQRGYLLVMLRRKDLGGGHQC